MTTSAEDLLKCLADSTRLRIVLLLLQAGELCVCELTTVLQLDQPKISRHLGVLRKANLVQDRREGQWIYYRLQPAMPLWAVEILQALARATTQQPPYMHDSKALHPGNAGCC